MSIIKYLWEKEIKSVGVITVAIMGLICGFALSAGYYEEKANVFVYENYIKPNLIKEGRLYEFDNFNFNMQDKQFLEKYNLTKKE